MGVADAGAERRERYRRRGFRQVEGWVQAGAFDLACHAARVQEARDVGGAVAEIGVHHGQLFILLCLLARDSERAVGVDLFDLQERNRDGSGRGDEARLRANLARHAGAAAVARVVLLSGDSTGLGAAEVTAAAGGPVRLFSVDGGHTAAVVGHDLETAAAALAPGGVVLLDDYFHDLFPGVAEATNDFMRGGNRGRLAPYAIGGNKLLLCSRAWAKVYLEALDAAADLGTARHEREMWGHRVIRFDFAPQPWRLRLRASPVWRALRDTPVGRLARAALRAATRRRRDGR